LQELQFVAEQVEHPEEPEAGVKLPLLLKLTAEISFSILALWHCLQTTLGLLVKISSSNSSPQSRHRNS